MITSGGIHEGRRRNERLNNVSYLRCVVTVAAVSKNINFNACIIIFWVREGLK